MKPKLDHPIIRLIIKIFAPGYSLHKNPVSKKKKEVLK